MRNLPWLRLAIYLDAVFTAALSQVSLKKTAMRSRRSFVEEYLDPWIIFAYGLFFLAMLIDVAAYRKVPLSPDPILEVSAHLYALISGAVFFGEWITRRKFLALALILDDIVLFTLSA